jgi:WD40 repeat protein
MVSTAIPGILKGHTGPVYALAPGRNDNTIFSGGSDGHIVEWNYDTLRQEGLVVKVSDAIFFFAIRSNSSVNSCRHR